MADAAVSGSVTVDISLKSLDISGAAIHNFFKK